MSPRRLPNLRAVLPKLADAESFEKNLSKIQTRASLLI